jgi:hypothetical protein
MGWGFPRPGMKELKRRPEGRRLMRRLVDG